MFAPEAVIHFVNFPEPRGTVNTRHGVKTPPLPHSTSSQPGVLSFLLYLLTPWSVGYQQHTQSHILAVKFHEVHLEDQIPTPVFSSECKPLATLPFHM